MTKDPGDINDPKPSFKRCVNKILLSMGIIEFVFIIRLYFDRGVSLSDLIRISFYLSSLYALFALRKLSFRWKNLILYWNDVEMALLNKLHSNDNDTNLLAKITIITVILMCGAIFDQIVYCLDEIADSNQIYHQCNITKYTSWEFLFHKMHPQYLVALPYHAVLFLPAEWVNACLNLAWNMQDILIIVVSLALIERFALWNSRVQRYELQVIPGRIWWELREDYTRLTELVLKVDEHLSTMILVSCAANLYQICSCVYQSLIPRPDFLDNLQFWYTFLFTLVRSILVFHFVAEIHERSVQSKLTIRIIPSKVKQLFFLQAQRLLDQMVSMDIALSGRKLFYITRKTILIILATVMTYEIVLVDRIPKEPLKKRVC
ncbi:gustatory receptor for sugar taste 61a-like [Culicoides brevitarsis]|uniref:gustatory receptor for sugar taste 61a-like n=1 Tax=Culicoides brevitarsis TaxID=469753 RepID=UPI00307C6B88